MPPELHRVARNQCGLLTLRQCDNAGLDRDEVRRRVRRKEWRRVRQGVVAVVPAPRVPIACLRERAMAALLVLPPGCVVTAVTSAVLWRVLDPECSGELVHVLLPAGVRHDAVRGVRLREGPFAVPYVVDDVPCADLPRTLVEACRELPLDRAVAMLDLAELVEPGTLGVCRAMAAGGTGRGSSAMRRTLDLATGRCESVLESLAWVLWHQEGLPAPLVQAVIRAGGRFLARVDFLWPEAMLIVEVDGMAKYDEPGELQREKERQNRLIAEGYVVLRFTWADIVHRPADVARRVRQALKINSGS